MNTVAFPSSTYLARRKELNSKIEKGLVVILGNNESPMNYPANWYSFRQDSSFLYYFGIDRPDFAATLDVESNECILFGNDFTIDDIVWMGPQPKVLELGRQVGIEQSRSRSSLSAFIKQARAQGRPVHFLPQYRADLMIELSESFGLSHGVLNQHASLELTKAVIDQRSIKSNEEIEEIEKAMEIAYEMHTTAMREVKPGLLESDVVGKIEGVARALGKQPSFPVIFSINGETLHNHYHGNRMSEGDIVVCDAGAEANSGYSSDITRTIPVGGKFTEQQKPMYELVLQALNQSIEEVKAGVAFRDIHLGAAKIITEGLQGMGLMKGNVDESVAAGAHALFFPCGLGHMMGLDVHDMEGLGEDLVGYSETIKRSQQFGLSYLRLGKELEVGHVLTVEPGIYFVPALIDKWQNDESKHSYINFDEVNKMRDFGGIRIEDDVLVTKDGPKILGKSIPKEVSDIEALVGTA